MIASMPTQDDLERLVRAYERGEISSGAAAKELGISKYTFLKALGAFGVSMFDMTREELEHDVKVAREASRFALGPGNRRKP